jgi:Leucine-rich repeat (LRR) protein
MKLFKSISSAIKEREEVKALKISVKGEEFPEELLDFPNLRELYLEGNCRKFPEHTPFWQNLQILTIKWPLFKGDLSTLFRLPQLENLKIIETPLKAMTLPLGHAPSPIKSLTIKDCALNSLPEEVSMLWQIQEMNCSGNELSSLPYSFIDLRNLRRLNLDRNQFSKFPDLIKRMSNLTHLSIDQNPFPEEEKERIQREFHIWL